jgi:predicted DNA-binding protein (MmcQ/YjbR family)
MKLAAFDAFCASLPGSGFVVQWGGAHVHKVGGKVFAIGQEGAFVFKATPLAYEVLREQGVAVRAPYLPRGNWLKVGAMPDAELRELLAQSYRLVTARLTKAVRAQLGI